MPKIIEYKKSITQQNTYELREVEGTELCTLGDTTYFAIPGTVLPTGQSSEIQSSIKATTLTDVLNDQIRAASPHCQLINSRRRQRLLGAGYSADDQDYYIHLHIAMQIGAVPANAKRTATLAAYVEAFKVAYLWAESQYAALGL